MADDGRRPSPAQHPAPVVTPTLETPPTAPVRPQSPQLDAHPTAPERDRQAESPLRKRRRRTIACAPCRSRKVKCDFGYPTCNRCLKGAGPDACIYESNAQQQQQQQQQQPAAAAAAPLSGSSSVAAAQWYPEAARRSNVDGTPLSAILEKRHDEESRIRELERVVQSLTQSSPSTIGISVNAGDSHRSQLGSTPGRLAEPSRDDVSLRKEQWRRDVPNRSHLGGKEGRTRFFGCTNASRLTFELEGLDAYMKELHSPNSILRSVHKDMNKSKKRNDSDEFLSGELATDNNFLRSLLPTRSIVDKLVDCYFYYVGRMHHVLHKQSFYKHLRALYDDPKTVPGHFIVQLLLVMASVWSVNTPSPLSPAGAKVLSQDIAVSWIRWAEAWIFHSNVKRPSLALLQVRCLLILAKEANFTQRNQAWAAAGTLVKMAMSAGCHREPQPTAKISIFNREMRRRIWATVIELDLQASLDRGMPPTIQQSDWDCNPPLNINDDDISEDTTVYPEEKPLGVMTDSSFHVALMQAVGLRLRICAVVNSPRFSMTPNELSLLEEELVQSLADIPDWQSAEHIDPIQKQQILLWRTVLECNLRRSQLSLYTYTALGGLGGSMSTHSNQARLEVAVVVLCQQQMLVYNVGKLAWCALTDATFHAAFTICHHLQASDSGFTSSIVRQVIPSITDILISLVQKTLTWLEEKFVVLEKGMREYAVLCASIGLVKTKLWPESAIAFRQQVIDRVSAAAYNILARQPSASVETAEVSRTQNFRNMMSESMSAPLPESPFLNPPPPIDDAFDFPQGFKDWDFVFGDFNASFPLPGM
ncbi:hypothetical protein FQN51_000914 [Onygenales sp. PD_10]|nr:hypothetical protein FQN51_000914 [Onygenales sp. PD_10]